MDSDDALRRIGSGFTIIGAGFVAGKILDYAVKVVLARFLGPTSYGTFVQGLAVVEVAAVVGLLGLDMGLPRFISHGRGREDPGSVADAIRTAGSIGMVGTLIATLTVGALTIPAPAAYLHQASIRQVLGVFYLGIIPLAVLKLSMAVLQGRQNARDKVLVSNIGLPALRLAGVGLLFWLGYGLMGAVYAHVAAFLIVAAVGVAVARHAIDVDLAAARFRPGPLLAFSWPLLGVSILASASMWMDVLMLGYFLPSGPVGVYEVALSIGGVLSLFLQALNYMFMPVVSELHGAGRAGQVRTVYVTATRWLAMLVIPAYAGMAIFPREILQILFGPEYLAGWLPLLILATGFFLSSLIGPAGMLLLSAGRTKTYLAGHALLVTVDFALNILLIPRYGPTGAAIAMTIAIVATNTAFLLLVRDSLGVFPYDREFVRPVAAGIVAGTIAAGLDALLAPGLAGSAGLGALLVVLYIAFLSLSGGIRSEDMAALQELLG